nr:hypothetical protein GCM10020185_00710 [Pseudomonas brassicacearum subsp. brassicacearum]
MAHANQSQEATTYFNLHTVGIGYLNRVREVQVRRGQPFMACDIAALHGATDAVEYTRFDCKVAGGEAERLIRLYMDAVNAEKKRFCCHSVSATCGLTHFSMRKALNKANRAPA